MGTVTGGRKRRSMGGDGIERLRGTHGETHKDVMV